MTGQQARAISVPTGNTYDKYGSRNPVVRRLMRGFEGALAQLLDRAVTERGIESLLDVGCGEGVLTLRWAQRLRDGQVVGLDLPDPKLEVEWRARERANLRFVAGSAEELPFRPGEFDLVAAIETLEHVPHPDRALAEMARVAGSHLLVSVPREPVWRAVNVMRGAYVRDLGNTPGHLNHWSRSGFEALLRGYGDVIDTRSPFPWTIVLVRVR